MARGAVPLLGAPMPGSVAFLFLVASLLSSRAGPLVPVGRLGLLVLMLLLVPALVLLLVVLPQVRLLGIGLVLGVFELLVVVRPVESRALSLLVPLAGSRPTVGSHCLAF